MYKLVKMTSLFECEPHGVNRILDNTFIPFDEYNTDYKNYLKWVAEGNTPEPADE
jgi:hypothetical protein